MRHDDPELLAACFHEAAHALAATIAFRRLVPRAVQPVRYVEVADDGSGNCLSLDVYSRKLPVEAFIPEMRPHMEMQVVIELSGGISEAIHHGVRRGREALRFAEAHCGVERDLERAEEVCRDIFRLIDLPVAPQHFADRTLALMLTHWSAVESLAAHLIERRRIYGRDVEAIIDRSLIASGSVR